MCVTFAISRFLCSNRVLKMSVLITHAVIVIVCRWYQQLLLQLKCKPDSCQKTAFFRLFFFVSFSLVQFVCLFVILIESINFQSRTKTELP